MNFMRKALVLTLILGMALFSSVPPSYARNVASDDTGTLGNDQWSITVDGHVIPNASGYDIGSADNYPDNIYLGGVGKSSWGSIVSPITDADGFVYPTDSGGVYRMYDAGYLSLGAGTAIDAYILLDTDDDDWYIGRDDTDNDFAIGVGSTLGTDERISIVDNATATIVVIGDGVNAEDKQITFDGNALDYYIAYDDSGDALVAGVDATVGTKPCFAILNEGSPLLYLYNGLDGVGAIDIDYGSGDITDHTFVSDGGTLILDGVITLTGSEVISNATDDTVRVASNDAAIVLEAYSPLTSNGDATLLLTADADADAGDRMAIQHDGATNSMLFMSDTASADTLATIMTLAKTGALTTTAAINAEIDNASNTSITDVLNAQHFTSGTAGAGIGVGLTFDLENDGGTEEEHASIDVVATSAANGAEDTDVVVRQMTAGALAETLRIVSASSATVGDQLVFTSNTTETNAVIDIFKLKTATGTAANGAGIGISFEPEDATGSEQVASLDIVQTTAARATNDTDFVFSQNINGTITETVRFDADASTGGAVAIEGASPLALGGTTADAYFTIIAVADAASSSKTVTLPSITSSIGLETVATVVITADTTATITVAPGTDQLFTYTIDTDDEDCTLTFSAGGTAGDVATLIFITDAAGSADEVMTFHGTLSDTEGTLTLANGTSKRYVIQFISDGTIWNEVSRTAVLG